VKIERRGYLGWALRGSTFLRWKQTWVSLNGSGGLGGGVSNGFQGCDSNAMRWNSPVQGWKEFAMDIVVWSFRLQ
jgi:hypothetical protein